MTVIGQDVLQDAGRRNTPLKKWLELWTATAEQRIWHSLEEVKADYPTADGVKLKSRLVITIFNVKGNAYRLLTWIDFDRWKDRY